MVATMATSGATGVDPGDRSRPRRRLCQWSCQVRPDQIELKEDKPTPKGPPGLELAPASERPLAVMNAAQKALTAPRKADGKMRRLKEEKERREKQWTQWAAETRASFFAQMKEYETDIARINDEMTHTAAAAMLVNHGLPPEEPMEVAEDNSWEQLLMAEPETTDDGSGFYMGSIDRFPPPGVASCTTGCGWSDGPDPPRDPTASARHRAGSGPDTCLSGICNDGRPWYADCHFD